MSEEICKCDAGHYHYAALETRNKELEDMAKVLIEGERKLRKAFNDEANDRESELERVRKEWAEEPGNMSECLHLSRFCQCQMDDAKEELRANLEAAVKTLESFAKSHDSMCEADEDIPCVCWTIREANEALAQIKSNPGRGGENKP